MKRHSRLLFWLLALSFAFAALSCTSASAPPAPVAEVPSLVSFPDSVAIDVSQASGSLTGSAMGTAALLKFGTTPTDFSDVISLGPITFTVFNSLLDDFLGPLADLEIPVSPTQRNFTGPMTFAPEVVGLAKIDFSDFDADGDGVLEGCTGCTCPVGCAPALTACPKVIPVADLKPVCYRIWLRDVGQTEFTRFAAGRIDRYATRDDPATPGSEKNAGNGSFRLRAETGMVDRKSVVAFGVFYQHRVETDPFFQETEFFVEDHDFEVETGAPTFTNAHSQVTQQTPKTGLGVENLKKTVKLDLRDDPDPSDGPGIVQYIGSFLDNFDFWSGTFHLQETDGSKSVSGENVCALISTGAETARQNCLDLGIDVGGQVFLRPTEPRDVEFPPDFPILPTF